MRILSTLAAAALIATCGTAAFARAHQTPEAELATALNGRVAGAPVRCIALSQIRGTRVIDHTAIIYDAGRTLYVNRPRGGAEHLDQWDVLVSKPFGGELCTPETIKLVDGTTHSLHGWVSLGEFVPYRKADATR